MKLVAWVKILPDMLRWLMIFMKYILSMLPSHFQVTPAYVELKEPKQLNGNDNNQSSTPYPTGNGLLVFNIYLSRIELMNQPTESESLVLWILGFDPNCWKLNNL